MTTSITLAVLHCMMRGNENSTICCYCYSRKKIHLKYKIFLYSKIVSKVTILKMKIITHKGNKFLILMQGVIF